MGENLSQLIRPLTQGNGVKKVDKGPVPLSTCVLYFLFGGVLAAGAAAVVFAVIFVVILAV